MALWCCLCDTLSSYSLVFVALAVIIASRVFLLSPSARRAPTRPARDASKRKHPRGTGADMQCVAPGTGEVLGTIKAYTGEDVKAAYKAARVAATESQSNGQVAWSQTSFEERRAVLQDIIDWIVENQPEIIEMSVRDSGKTGQRKQTCSLFLFRGVHVSACGPSLNSAFFQFVVCCMCVFVCLLQLLLVSFSQWWRPAWAK
jgi:hypothetical protein